MTTPSLERIGSPSKVPSAETLLCDYLFPARIEVARVPDAEHDYVLAGAIIMPLDEGIDPYLGIDSRYLKLWTSA